MKNKQVLIKLDILQTKLESVIQVVKNLDFTRTDNKDRDNLLYTLEECSGRIFELRQALPTL